MKPSGLAPVLCSNQLSFFCTSESLQPRYTLGCQVWSSYTLLFDSYLFCFSVKGMHSTYNKWEEAFALTYPCYLQVTRCCRGHLSQTNPLWRHILLFILGSFSKHSPSTWLFVTLDLKVELADDKPPQYRWFKTYESFFSHLYTIDTDNAFLVFLIRSTWFSLLLFGIKTPYLKRSMPSCLLQCLKFNRLSEMFSD